MSLPQYGPPRRGQRPNFAAGFTPQLGESIRARLEGGEPLSRLCAAPDMPSLGAVYRWRDRYRDWGQALVAAQQAGARVRQELTAQMRQADPKPPSAHRWALTGARADHARRKTTVLEVARRLANRQTLKEICADPDMPHRTTLSGWFKADPELAQIYRDARATQRASYEAEIDDIFGKLTKSNRAASKARFRKLRTEMARRIPKGWGLDPDLPGTWRRALAHWERADPPAPSDTPEAIKAARKRLGLSQAQFAARFGLSAETLRNYEQGHRRPTGPTRVLLAVIAAEPAAVMRVVGDGLSFVPLSGTLTQIETVT